MHSETFVSEGFVVCAVWLQPEHTVMFDDSNTPHGRKFKGIVTSLGGQLSHAVVVARGMDIPCVIAPAEFVNEIKPGDRVEITPDGVVHVNGGDPNFVPQEKVDMVSALFRFVFSKGEGKVAKINPRDINAPGTMHPDLTIQLAQEGYVSWDDPSTITLGYINEDGSVDQSDTDIPDQNVFESWISHIRREHQLPSGTIRRVKIS